MERWHLPLVAAGVATGLVCTVASLLWHRWRPIALAVTASAAMAVVVLVNETSSWWGVVAVLAAALIVQLRPGTFWIGTAVVLAATALAVGSYPTEIRVAAMIIVAVAAGVEAMTHRRPLAGSAGAMLVLLAAPVLTWVCVPDTEAVVVVGSTVAVLLIVSLATNRARPIEGQLPFLVLLTLAAADGFRGRPAGMAAFWVITATILGWAVAALVLRRRHDRSEPYVPLVGAWVVVVIAGAVARTAGLSWDVGRAAAAGGAATVAVLVICALMLRSTSTTQAGGGTEGQAVPAGEDRSGPGQGRERVDPES